MPQEPARSAEVLSEMMASSAKLRELAAQDPAVQKAIADGLVRYLPTPAFVSNATIYIIVVSALGLVALSAVIGAILLSYGATASQAFRIPETITALGSTAVGALAGLLAPSPGSKT